MESKSCCATGCHAPSTMIDALQHLVPLHLLQEMVSTAHNKLRLTESNDNLITWQRLLLHMAKKVFNC
eukprot:6025373-Ditylum_brightwellii.AAC.1